MTIAPTIAATAATAATRATTRQSGRNPDRAAATGPDMTTVSGTVPLRMPSRNRSRSSSSPRADW